MDFSNFYRQRGLRATSLVCVAALAGAATVARADELSDLKAQSEAANRQNQELIKRIDQIEQRQQKLEGAPGTAPAAGDDGLTWNGVTLYGAIDLGLTYQTHGTPTNQSYGDSYFISKNSTKGRFLAAPNALSYSYLGLKGDISLVPGWAAVFKLETAFIPTSGQSADPLKALTQNNGVALANQNGNADSSRAGQLFNNQGYFGVSSPTYGTLTFGRQYSLGLDNVIAYDPQGGAPAFSLIGNQGATGGGGSTESARLDSALKYRFKLGPARIGTLYQFAGAANSGRGAYQLNVGTDAGALSVDAVYSKVYDAIAAASLSATQVLTLPTNSLSGTVSDNTAWTLSAKYDLDKVRLFAGYSHLLSQNPSTPLSAGASAQGGYLLSVVNNTAFTNNRVLQVYWT
ncbi:MAG TPA: porin, partial [Burkholderiales bacterium]|nr:porin [Burkholderiales bacterium]